DRQAAGHAADPRHGGVRLGPGVAALSRMDRRGDGLFAGGRRAADVAGEPVRGRVGGFPGRACLFHRRVPGRQPTRRASAGLAGLPAGRWREPGAALAVHSCGAASGRGVIRHGAVLHGRAGTGPGLAARRRRAGAAGAAIGDRRPAVHAQRQPAGLEPLPRGHPAGHAVGARELLCRLVVHRPLGGAGWCFRRGRRDADRWPDVNTSELIITWATPFFFGLIAIEFIVARLRGRRAYRSNDSINSIGLGVMSQIAGVFMKLLTLGIYAWCVQHVALFALPAHSLWVWISGLLLYDFLYYWLHRMGHEVNILWAAHVVHHQSEEYNLSTALRQTSTGGLLGWIFYLPMAVLGYPLEVFVVIALIDLLYQFWVHT